MTRKKDKPIQNFRGFYKPAALLADKRMNPFEKDLLCDIHTLKGSYCFSFMSIARKFGVKSRFTPSRAIERLKGIKMIESQTNDNKNLRLTEKALELFEEKPKKIPAPKTVQEKIEPSGDAIRLSGLFYDLIAERKPDYLKPDLGKWAIEIDRMIRFDKRTPEKVEAVLRWAQNDSGNGQNWQGWQSVILSAKKLREKFDKLEMQMAGTKNGTEEIKPGGHYR